MSLTWRGHYAVIIQVIKMTIKYSCVEITFINKSIMSAWKKTWIASCIVISLFKRGADWCIYSISNYLGEYSEDFYKYLVIKYDTYVNEIARANLKKIIVWIKIYIHRCSSIKYKKFREPRHLIGWHVNLSLSPWHARVLVHIDITSLRANDISVSDISMGNYF